MADMANFESPDFLKNQTEAEIHRKMLAEIAEKHPEVDLTEGSFLWDFTRPTAKEKARMVGFTLTEIIKNMFPMWSYGKNLDWQANVRGMTRKEARTAAGVLTIVGKAGTVIPEGFIFNTESSYGDASVLFKAEKTVVISGEGTGQTAMVPIVAYYPGVGGNVPPGTITMLNEPLKGIESVVNAEKTDGGSDLESDELLIERIVEYDQNQGVSFVGSDTDYRRWAMEVVGVGGVDVIAAAAGAEIVTLILVDTQGQPATTELCTQVYDHIVAPADRTMRLAGVNDIVRVIPAVALAIAVSLTVVIDDDWSLDDVKLDLYAALRDYYKIAMAQNVVKISQVGAIINAINGVTDYSDLKLNGATVNVPVATGSIPVTVLENIVMVA